MLNRPKRRGITLSPGTDRRKLSLNSFVAYGRVEILGAFLQASQEVVSRRLAVPGLCEEKKLLRVLVGGTCLAECIL